MYMFGSLGIETKGEWVLLSGCWVVICKAYWLLWNMLNILILCSQYVEERQGEMYKKQCKPNYMYVQCNTSNFCLHSDALTREPCFVLCAFDRLVFVLLYCFMLLSKVAVKCVKGWRTYMYIHVRYPVDNNPKTELFRSFLLNLKNCHKQWIDTSVKYYHVFFLQKKSHHSILSRTDMHKIYDNKHCKLCFSNYTVY